MEIVLLIIVVALVVALITSIFVFKSDKFFYIYDSLEQKRARLGQYLSGPWE